jgi:hypothetical protein
VSLRAWNGVLAALHGGQAVLLLALASDASLPVTATWIEGPPASGTAESSTLFELPFGPAVAAFLLLAALDHALVASPWLAGWYERNVARGVNPIRWWEYSLSASLMVVLIAMLTGARDLGTLIALAGANAAMILFGLAMEERNRPGEPVDWRPFVYGCLVGAVPWAVIALQLGRAQAETGSVPGFVFAIFGTLFVLFMSFAVNMWLQYARIGPWRSYAFAERGYLMLSLVAKSALAWQVYAGALAG